MKSFRLVFILSCGILLTGCVDRLVVGEDPTPIERPDVTHHVPLNGADNVPSDVEPMLWFNMLMNESTIGDRMDFTLALELSEVSALGSSGDVLLAGTERGDVFRSEDEGQSWRWVSEGMFVTARGFAGSGDVVYMAADDGLYRSADRGETWSVIANAPVGSSVVVDPANPNRLFLATASEGVLYSEDGGSTWTSRSSGLRSGGAITFLVMHPAESSTLFAAVQDDFVYRTTDAGVSWTRLREGLTTRDLFSAGFTPADSPELLLATGAGVFVSTDEGDSFEPLPPPAEGVAVRSVTARDRNLILAGTDEGMFITRNRGQTWSAATGPTGLALSPSPVAALLLSSSNRLIVGTEDALYRSVDDLGRLERVENVPLENLRVTGSLTFGRWQGPTLVETYEDFSDPASLDTTTIAPFVNERALATWIAGGRQGTPPVDPDPEATWARFTPDEPLTPGRTYLVRIYGTFIDAGTGTTLSGELGPEDLFGNTMEFPDSFSFTVADE